MHTFSQQRELKLGTTAVSGYIRLQGSVCVWPWVFTVCWLTSCTSIMLLQMWKIKQDVAFYCCIKMIWKVAQMQCLLTFQNVYSLCWNPAGANAPDQVLFSLAFQKCLQYLIGMETWLSLSLSPSPCDVLWWSDMCSHGSLHFLLSSSFKLTHWKKQHFRKVTRTCTHTHT